MRVNNSTNNCNKTAPGMMATVASVIIDRTKKKTSQIETGSQIAWFEEELHQAG